MAILSNLVYKIDQQHYLYFLNSCRSSPSFLTYFYMQSPKQNNHQVLTQNKSQDNEEYFEKQKAFTLLCGLHSVNNVLRRKAYTEQDMVAICCELSNSFINPHKHIMGGDYDANVIMIALQRQGYTCQWINKKKPFQLAHYLDQTNKTKEPLNFLVNCQVPKRFYHKLLKFSARHWYIIRERLHGQARQFQICDSNQQSPKLTQNPEKLEKYLKNLLKTDIQLIWVHKTVQ